MSKAKGTTRSQRAPTEDERHRAEKIARDAGRYQALAREHGAVLSEEGFNEALRKVAQHRPEHRLADMKAKSALKKPV